MKKIWKNYKSSLILLIGVIIGSIVGLIFKEQTKVLSPFGDLFLNLLLVSIVPLIFFSISSSIAKMQGKRFSKIIGSIIIVFILTSIMAVLLSFAITKHFNLININDQNIINETLNNETKELNTNVNYLEKTINMLSVNDFAKILTKDNMIALIVFSVLFGVSVNISKDKGKLMTDFLESGTTVMMNYIKLIMYYAPFGLGCYFAVLVGTLGSVIAIGYLKIFLLYLLVSFIFYFGFYTLLAFLSAGKKGIRAFWQNILPASLMALGTCSSAASMPSNIACTEKIGVPKDISETTISLGTSFHKDGSNIGSVFKIMFLACLFGTNVVSFNGSMQVLGVALIATLLVSAVPIGGGTISEMLIISLMGYPVSALPILTIIATIIDAPATLLNVVGDSSSAMLITRFVEGKNWLKTKN